MNEIVARPPPSAPAIQNSNISLDTILEKLRRVGAAAAQKLLTGLVLIPSGKQRL